MKKLFDKDAAKRFWENIKKLFVRKPQNEGAAGKYLKYVDEDSTEWADFPSFLNYKGTTKTETTLRAKTDAAKGDVYTVEDTGAEWFYDGENWEYIGELIGGNFVKRTGDSMSGALKIDFNDLTIDLDSDGITITGDDGKGNLISPKITVDELKIKRLGVAVSNTSSVLAGGCCYVNCPAITQVSISNYNFSGDYTKTIIFLNMNELTTTGFGVKIMVGTEELKTFVITPVTQKYIKKITVENWLGKFVITGEEEYKYSESE